MLQRIESPDTVLAYRAVGRIEKDDYKVVLTPAVDAKSDEKPNTSTRARSNESLERCRSRMTRW